jgi:hypothetical protein
MWHTGYQGTVHRQVFKGVSGRNDMTATPLDRAAILKAIEELPPDQQLEVAQQIMRHYLAAKESSHPKPPAHWVSWRELAGIALPPDGTPPPDSEIASWLDERRMKEAD